jgi:hypothetical protein
VNSLISSNFRLAAPLRARAVTNFVRVEVTTTFFVAVIFQTVILIPLTTVTVRGFVGGLLPQQHGDEY